MKDNLLEILTCPECPGSSLTLSAAARGEDGVILRGSLDCGTCKRSYPIRDSVPYLLGTGHLEATQEEFARQWDLRADGTFEHDQRLFMFTHERRIEQYEALFEESLVRPSHGGRRWFLDAGCGPAEPLAMLAERHPDVEFVGLDFTSTAERAAKRFAHIPNLQFVRGDVARLPFGPVFEGVLSYGVIHCLPFETKLAFERVAAVVAPGGRLVVWIYPSLRDARDPLLGLYWGIYYGMRDVVFLARGHRLPSKVRLALLKAILKPASKLVPLSLLNRIDPFDFRDREDFYRCALFMAFDDVSPEFQRRHAADEVDGWYRELGFVESAPWTAMDSRNWCGLYVGRRPPQSAELRNDSDGRAARAS